MHPAPRPQQMDLGTMAPDMKLCREPAFITSVLTGAQRALAACEASDLTAAIATGTGDARWRLLWDGAAVLGSMQEPHAHGLRGIRLQPLPIVALPCFFW